MKDIKDINGAVKTLAKLGFRCEHGSGSRLKLFPPNKDLPLYVAHINDKAFHPLRRFAQNNWGIVL